MRDGGIRYSASKNDIWYQDYYKQNGRKPNKAEAQELADKLVSQSLKTRSGEFYNEDLGWLMDEMQNVQPKKYGNIPKRNVADRTQPIPEAPKPPAGSKVVDDNGKPLTVYHGTATEFDKFDKAKRGENYRQGEDGFFFTSKEQTAKKLCQTCLYVI